MLYVATDIIGTLRYEGYRYTEQQFSELTAQGAPTRSFMVAFNVIPYDLLVGAFAAGIWIAAAPKRIAHITSAKLLGYAVVGVIGGGIFPMETRGNEQTLRNVMHIPVTAVMSIFILLAMGFGSRMLGRRFRYYSYGTIATLLVFGVLASTQAGRLAANEPTPWMGIHERVNIYATMAWLATLSVALLRAEGTFATSLTRDTGATPPGCQRTAQEAAGERPVDARTSEMPMARFEVRQDGAVARWS